MNKLKQELTKVRRRLVRLADELADIEQVMSDTEAAPQDEGAGEIVGITEMATMMNVSLPTIRRYIKDGKLAPYRVGSRQYFLRSEIPQILKAAGGGE